MLCQLCVPLTLKSTFLNSNIHHFVKLTTEVTYLVGVSACVCVFDSGAAQTSRVKTRVRSMSRNFFCVCVKYKKAPKLAKHSFKFQVKMLNHLPDINKNVEWWRYNSAYHHISACDFLNRNKAFVQTFSSINHQLLIANSWCSTKTEITYCLTNFIEQHKTVNSIITLLLDAKARIMKQSLTSTNVYWTHIYICSKRRLRRRKSWQMWHWQWHVSKTPVQHCKRYHFLWSIRSKNYK